MIEARSTWSIACFLALAILVSLNVAWAHQTILLQALPLHPYYENGFEPPFEHRTLLRILYFALFGARIHEIGMNAPLASSAQVFQLAVDTICLFLTCLCMMRIARKVWPLAEDATIACTSATFLLLIVVFGYFFVPNKPFFYPYDFLELLIFASFVALALSGCRWADALSILLLAAGALNKETAIFGWLVYLTISRRRPPLCAGERASGGAARICVDVYRRRRLPRDEIACRRSDGFPACIGQERDRRHLPQPVRQQYLTAAKPVVLVRGRGNVFVSLHCPSCSSGEGSTGSTFAFWRSCWLGSP